MLRENKKFVKLGVSLHLLHREQKRPKSKGWQHAARQTYTELAKCYKKGDNIGMRTGRPSKTKFGFVHVIDIDIRDGGAASECWDQLRRLFPNVMFDRFPMVRSGSGGASCHIWFVTEAPLLHSKKLAAGDDWQIELFGTGKQVVIPPSIHPNTKRPYEWICEFDPDKFIPEIPYAELLEIVEVECGEDDFDWIGCKPLDDLDIEDARELIFKLDRKTWCDPRDKWLLVGMALHYQFDGSRKARELWFEFSRRSKVKKLNEQEALNDWRSFGRTRRSPFTMRSIIQEVRGAERREEIDADFQEMDQSEDELSISIRAESNVSAPVDIAAEFDELPPDDNDVPGVPTRLLRIPGDLRAIVDYYNDTAKRPQPQFAVQTALALGSIALARMYVTDLDNMSSLYFLNIAKTATGKEHAKTVIERVLKEAGLADLIGPKGYTSEAGVISALRHRPRHICIIDEFGRYLKSARTAGNSNKQDVQSAWMEIFGRLGDTYRGIGYSTHNMTKEQAELVRNSKIEKPGLTLLGMTTPSTFYEALSGSDVTDGFLNRLIIVESPLGRRLSRQTGMTKVPPKVTRWLRDYARQRVFRSNEHYEDFMFQLERDAPPDPIIIPFHQDCLPILEEMELHINDAMDESEERGMAELYGRTKEIAQRIALIVALSCRSKTILPSHLKWSRDYAFFYQEKMASVFSTEIGKTTMQSIADDVIRLIASRGSSGMTEREIVKSSRRFDALEAREREAIVYRMKSDHGIRFDEIKENDDGTRRRGARRKAFIAPKRLWKLSSRPNIRR